MFMSFFGWLSLYIASCIVLKCILVAPQNTLLKLFFMCSQIKQSCHCRLNPTFLERPTSCNKLHRIEAAFRRPPDHIAAISPLRLAIRPKNTLWPPPPSISPPFSSKSTADERWKRSGTACFHAVQGRAGSPCWRLFCSPAFCHTLPECQVLF